MALDCPRCAVALEPPPEDFETRETAHRCHRCHGAWVDGERVGAAYPALRKHGQRLGELVQLGAREDGATCPRCAVAMLEFPFFDLWLDLCERCHGMWVDGDEKSFVDKTSASETGLPRAKRGPGYREHAQPEVDEERVSCVACNKDVHPRRTLLTADGAVCDHCVEIDEMTEVLRGSGPLERMARTPGTVLGWIGKIFDASGKLLQRGAPK